MRFHESVLAEFELTSHESVRELPRIDGEGADVASDLGGLAAAGRRTAEHDLEDALTRFVGAASNENEEMGLDRYRSR